MNESNIFGISIRAYIVFLMVTAFVIMSFMKMDVDSTFSTLVVSLISFYFGNKVPPSQGAIETKIEPPSPIVSPKNTIVEGVKL